jgi:hypothetical protein
MADTALATIYQNRIKKDGETVDYSSATSFSVPTPTADAHAATKLYVDQQVATADTWAEVLANGNTSGGTNVIVSAGDTLTVDTITDTSGSGTTIESVLINTGAVSGVTTLAHSGVLTASGAHDITIANNGNDVALTITQNDVTNNPIASSITNAGTGHSLLINQNGALGASQAGIMLASSANNTNTDATVGLLSARQLNASTAQACAVFRHDGTGYGLFIDENGDGIGMLIDTEATTAAKYGLIIQTGQGADALQLSNSANYFTNLCKGTASATAGNHFYRNLASGDTNSPLVFIEQDNASDDQIALKIQQDGANAGISIDHNSTAGGVGLTIDKAAGTDYGMRINMTDGNTRSGILMFGNGPAGNNGFDGYMIAIQNADTANSGGIHSQVAGTNAGLFVDKNNTGNSIEIDADANSASAMYGLVMNIANAGAGLEYAMRFNGSEIVSAAVGGSQDKKIRISIAGTDYFIPCNTA